MDTQVGTASSSGPSSPAASGAEASRTWPARSEHLRPTRLLDYGHPAVETLVRDRSWRHLPELDRVGAVYAYVRDEVPFGYNAADDLPASAVLADGYGQCNTKTTLLMALLRATGVPCRLHGGAIRKELQRGVVTGLAYRLAPDELLHTWAEVPAATGWVGLEGVILDGDYLDGLRRRFPDQRSAFLGYGVGTENLAEPSIGWRGAPTSIQATGLVRDYGGYPDPDAFYAGLGGNLSGWRAALYRRVVRHRMNRAVRRIRSSPACCAV